MTNFLITHFVKNHGHPEDAQVRLAYAMLASISGMVCNLFLFALKLIAGTLAGSIAVISDAFNNLTDCLSNIVSMVAYVLASKPADKEHPFGHGRLEYIVSLFIAALILIVAWELFGAGMDRILHPSMIRIEPLMVVLLLTGIGVKYWMEGFYAAIGNTIRNPGILASSEDSRSDVLVSLSALSGMLFSGLIPEIPIDGLISVVIAGFIVSSGFRIASDVVSRLLGGPADPQLVKDIQEMVLSFPEILGMHDLILHDYGAGCCMGSAHIEINSSMTLNDAHDAADHAERKVKEKLHVDLILHMDPVNADDPETLQYRKRIEHLLKSLDVRLQFHDLHILKKKGKKYLMFDVLIPYECRIPQEKVDEILSAVFEEEAQLLINYDHA